MSECDDTTTSDIQPQEKYENNGKGWYFRFADDNVQGYMIYPFNQLNVNGPV